MSGRPTRDDQRPPAGEDRWRYIDRIDARRIMPAADGAVLLPGNSVSDPKGRVTIRCTPFGAELESTGAKS
jgi:hypothetical protein